MSAPAKITYTSASGDLEEFHHRFDTALDSIRRQAGTLHPFFIGGEPVETREEPLVDRSPIDTGVVLGRFAAATPEHVDRADALAGRHGSQVAWRRSRCCGRRSRLERHRPGRVSRWCAPVSGGGFVVELDRTCVILLGSAAPADSSSVMPSSIETSVSITSTSGTTTMSPNHKWFVGM